MKRIVALIAVFVMLLMFSSCAAEKNMKISELFMDKDQVASDNRIKYIIKSIEDNNSSALMSMFSGQAGEDAGSLSDSIQCFLDSFDDHGLVWESNAGPMVEEAVDYGIKTKKITNWYNVSGTKKNYIFFFVEWLRDDTNNENVGVYTLRIMEEEDIEEQFIKYDRMEIPGIYYNPGNLDLS